MNHNVRGQQESPSIWNRWDSKASVYPGISLRIVFDLAEQDDPTIHHQLHPYHLQRVSIPSHNCNRWHHRPQSRSPFFRFFLLRRPGHRQLYLTPATLRGIPQLIVSSRPGWLNAVPSAKTGWHSMTSGSTATFCVSNKNLLRNRIPCSPWRIQTIGCTAFVGSGRTVKGHGPEELSRARILVMMIFIWVSLGRAFWDSSMPTKKCPKSAECSWVSWTS